MTHAITNPAKLFSSSNTSLKAGTARRVSTLFFVVGAVALALTILGALQGDQTTKSVALAGWQAGFMAVLGLTLGSTFLVMIFHQVNAGWTAALRRQPENVMSMIPVCIVLFLPTAILAPWIFHWMNPDQVAGDTLYQAKSAFLNRPFFYARAVVYFSLWLLFTQRIYRLSIGQDTDGDPRRSFKARRMSSYGLVVMAFTSAFAGFDWLMSLDYHWFSTMFGVYFFAGFIGAAVSLCALIVILLRRTGALDGIITNEHIHDLGKLMFGFVVFWAYIGFSQYFLIWYGNIPEETMWFQIRRTDHWMPYSIALAFGRFIVPFVILMPRPWRRSSLVIGVMAVWLIAFNIVDMYWIVRPTVEAVDGGEVGFMWLDVAAVLAPVCLFFGLLVRRIASNPLAPMHDPRMDEGVEHKNYV